MTFFLSNHSGSRIPSLWMVHAGFVFVAGMLGHEYQDLSETVRWNACLHRLDFALYRHPKEFQGIESEPTLCPRENSLYQRLRGGLNLRHYIMQDSKPNTPLTGLFRPHINPKASCAQGV